MELTKEQSKEFREALIDAFPSADDLEMMLSEELGWELNQSAVGKKYQTIVYNLIKWAEAQGKIKELLEAAIINNPGNPKLKKFNDSYLSPITQDEIKKLTLILSQINFDLIKSACSKILLSNNKDTIELIEAKNIDDIILILCELYPKTKIGVPSIVKFAEKIVNNLEKSTDEYLELLSWLKEISSRLSIEISLESNEKSQSTESKYHLLLIVYLEGEKFRLEAVYTQDGRLKNWDYFQETNSSSTPVKSNVRKGNLCSSFEEVSKQVEKIVKYFLDYINDDFIIEIYLPYKHLYENIDINWCIPSDFIDSEPVPILEKFSIVLHSTDRLAGLSLKNLKEGWKKLISIIDENPSQDDIQKKIETISQTHKLDWKKLEKKLLKDKIGMKLTKHLSNSSLEQENFIKAIINGGIPFAFWTRGQASRQRKLEQIDCYLNAECLKNNLEKLMAEICLFRRDAYLAEEPSKHLGYHLGFLCDDPDKIQQIKPKPLKF